MARGLVPAKRGAHLALGARDAIAAALAEDLALTKRNVELGLLEYLLRIVLDPVAFLGSSSASLYLVGGAFLTRHTALLGAVLLPVEQTLELVFFAIDAALCELLDLLVRVDLLDICEASLLGFFHDRFEVLVQLGVFLLTTALLDVGTLGLTLETVLFLDARALGFGSAQLCDATPDDVLDLVLFEALVLLITPVVVGGQLLLLVAPGGVGVDSVGVHFHDCFLEAGLSREIDRLVNFLLASERSSRPK